MPSIKLNIIVLLVLLISISCQKNSVEYVCTPCDLFCDTIIFSKAGICPHCKMDLIKKSSLTPQKKLILNEISIENGAGRILVEGGFQKAKTIVIHYFKPENYTKESPVVFVVPGAGRNGDDYRNAWVDKAKEYGLIVLSPEYSESYYPDFWSYNLAGMIKDVEINEERTAMTKFRLNDNPEEWIYNDFDRIFYLIKKELNLTIDSYDMFGHSAGGQIVHRLAIFKSESLANRMLASNSGWYTLPNDLDTFPYGLKNLNISTENIDFSNNLVVFLGEKDDVNETRGELRRSQEVDKQGIHRLERGQYFYEKSEEIATKLNADFNWKIKVIPNIGHDYIEMSKAAADFLYAHEK